MEIKRKAVDINNIINETIDNISNKNIVKKSLSVEKAIAIIEIELKNRVSDSLKLNKQDLLFIKENGVTIIIEIDLPLTTKNEQILKKAYQERGYYFSYNINQYKKKYYLCISTR